MPPNGPQNSPAAWIDVFNGDADGICALHQLRLHAPRAAARLVTGAKRDIALLNRLQDVSNSEITVLDISLDANRQPLERMLACDNRIVYADHHFSGSLPSSPALEAHLDPSPSTCTSLIIDRLLAGAHRPWALVGAYGDHLDEVAASAGRLLGLDDAALAVLREIGRLLNYNGYGFTEEDLIFHPAELFHEVHRYLDPFAFHRESPVLPRLRQGYANDMAQVADLTPDRIFPCGRIFHLPEAAWARRVYGVLANQLAREQPDLAHALILPRMDGTLMISVRAPLATRQGAETLCRQFATGGGRSAAAGINALPGGELEPFLAAFARHFSS